MTPSHLQSLISDLDSLLSQSVARLSWSTSDNWVQQEQTRQILLKVRAYLATLADGSSTITPQWSQPLREPFDTDFSRSDEQVPDFNKTQEKWVEQITSAVIDQINHQLADWFNSLETELDSLRQQKQSLQEDIQNLQQQHQKMIADFTQLLMRRSQDILQQQIDQTQQTIAQRLSLESSALINPSAILEQLIQLQHHSDQLLTHLDTTFRTVFETLEQDLQGYSQSLSQGVERMHSLGQQGEAHLLAYINRLSEQIESPPPLSETPLPPENEPTPIDTVYRLTDLIDQTRPLVSQLIPDTPFSPPSLQEEERVTTVSPFPSPESHQNLNQGWYLGIDFGSVALTAVLSKTNLEATTGTVIEEYPLYWSIGEASTFRMPTPAYSSIEEGIPTELENLKSLLNETSLLPEDIWLILISLFSSLKSSNPESNGRLKVMTNELSPVELESALEQLEGIIFSIPTGWGKHYRSHLKEAVLGINLVKHETQIFFVEEAIATFLAHLPLATASELLLSQTTTLVINSGETTTDLALVNVANPIQTLSYNDFLLKTVAYGGATFEQDIFCQLIYPQWFSQLNFSLPQLAQIIPQAGIPDAEKRGLLKQRLQANPLGGSLIEVAKLAKLILQQQQSFTSQLNNQPWTLQRRDLEKIVIRPFLQYLEEQIHPLLSQKNLSCDDIGQVIISGGTSLALGDCLLTWINNTFPEAIVFQDTEMEIISRVATGLARLPFFPNLVGTLGIGNRGKGKAEK